MPYSYMLSSSKMTVIILSLLFSVISCKQNKDTKLSTSNLASATELPYGFEEFYQQFQEDTAFQLRHIIFPLEGMIYDEIQNEMVKHKFNKEDWVFHRAFNDQNGSFVQNFSVFGDIVTEHTMDTHGAKMEMVRRFAVIDDEWHLIYYKPMGFQ